MSRVRPFYQDKSVTIYHGDMRKLIGLVGQVDATITDPPYGETALRWDVWPLGWLDMLIGHSPQIWCFGSLRMFWDRAACFQNWKLAQDVIWEKQNGSGLHNDRFRRVHEQVVHLYRGEWRDVYHKPVFTYDAKNRNVKRRCNPAHWSGISQGHFTVEENGPRLKRSVIYCNSMHRRAVHPTQKPEEIIVPLMEYSVPLKGLVLDPFVGSGTTLVVAKKLGRRAIGFDIDRHSCELAAKAVANV